MAKTPEQITPEMLAAVLERQIATSLSNQQADFSADNHKSRSRNTTLLAGGGATVLTAFMGVIGLGVDHLDALEQRMSGQDALIQKVEDLTTELKLLRKQSGAIGMRVIATEMTAAEGFAWISAIAAEPNLRKRKALLEKMPTSIRASNRRARNLRETQAMERLFRDDGLSLSLAQ